MSESAQGCLLAVLSVALGAAGARACWKGRAGTGPARRWLLGAFAALMIGDAGYAVTFYVLRLPPASVLATVLTNLPYPAAYLCFTCSLLARMRRAGRSTTALGVVLLPLFISGPAVFKLLHAFSASVARGPLSIMVAGELLNALTSFAAFHAAFYVLLSSRRLGWSLHAVGVMTLVLLNWGLSAEMLDLGLVRLGFFDYAWLLGVAGAALPVAALDGMNDAIEPFDSSSLAVTYKTGTSALTFLFLGFLALAQIGSPFLYRAIAAGCSLGMLVSALVSHFLARRVEAFASRLAAILAAGDDSPGEPPSTRDIPAELVQTLGLAFDKRAELRASRARTELAAQVAHDIRSPLAAIELVVGGAGELPEDLRELLRGAAGRIRAIAQDVLASARPARAAAACAVCGVVDAIVAEKRLEWASRPGLRLESRREPGAARLAVRADSADFGRIVSNLLNNAAEAVDGAGEVRVAVALSHGLVSITVSDDGKGIAPELLPELGRRGATFGKEGGSGLGLWHATQRAREWGGTLSIRSEPGRGTEVELRLPESS
jgi:signal transduction histidine kinase